MTEPYTAGELPEVMRKLLDAAEVVDEAGESSFDGADDLPDMARLAATLREYERVVKENAKLRESLDHYREHRTLLEAEVAALAAVGEG